MNVETELCEATEVKLKKGESKDAYMKRLAEEAFKLEENIWGSLSKPAQKWVNSAIVAADAGADVDDFPADGKGKAAAPREEEPEQEEETQEEEEEEEEPRYARGARPMDEDAEDHDETAEEDNEEMATLSTDRGTLDGRSKATHHRGVKRAVRSPPPPSTKIRAPRPPKVLSAAERMEKVRAARKTATAVQPAPASRKKQTKGVTARVLVRQLVAKNPKITKEVLIERVRAAGHEVVDNSLITWRYDILQILRMLDQMGMLKKSL